MDSPGILPVGSSLCTLLFTPFSVTRSAMHRNYATCIISCVDCLGISMHKCMETPRGILPVNNNFPDSYFQMAAEEVLLDE